MSNKTLNVLVLAAGASDSAANDGGYPACLTEIEGRPLLELVVEKAATIENTRFTFALREDDVARFHLDKVAELLAPGASVVRIPAGTRGSACSALMAASTIPAHEEVLIISANELVDIHLPEMVADFRRRQLDGGTLTFLSVHPRYSYVRLNAEGLVTEASQQNPISKNATTGIFWFARADKLVEAIKGMIRKDAHVGGSYYVAKAFNELILKQRRIGVLPIETHQYHPLKTGRQLYQFEQHGAIA